MSVSAQHNVGSISTGHLTIKANAPQTKPYNGTCYTGTCVIPTVLNYEHLYLGPGVLTQLPTCNILSGEASIPGIKLLGAKAICSTSAK